MKGKKIKEKKMIEYKKILEWPTKLERNLILLIIQQGVQINSNNKNNWKK